jgi:hypothetical protein
MILMIRTISLSAESALRAGRCANVPYPESEIPIKTGVLMIMFLSVPILVRIPIRREESTGIAGNATISKAAHITGIGIKRLNIHGIKLEDQESIDCSCR